jgi:hypothetical protein
MRSGTSASARATGLGVPTVLLGRLLGDERAADRGRAHDAERLGRDLRRGPDDRQRGGALGLPEGERGERAAREDARVRRRCP